MPATSAPTGGPVVATAGRRARTDLATAPARVGAVVVEPSSVAARWLGVEAASAYASVSTTTIRRACWSGTLAASRVGSRLLVAVSDLEAWLRSQRVGGPA